MVLVNQIYLKKISIIITACMTKPIPIVKMLSMSFWTAALVNSKINPVQIINITSTGGGLSVIPAINAINDGMVAPCIKRTESHPSVSAENLEIRSPKNFLIESVIL